MSTLPTAVVLTGDVGHTDQWHHLSATSEALKTVLIDRVKADVVLTSAGVLWNERPDLVIVNVGASPEPDAADSRRIVDQIEAASAAGAAVLGVHTATLAFPSEQRWADLVGGRWVRGTTFHPQIGRALVQIDDEFPVGMLDDFVAYDERYSALEQGLENHRIAFHTEDGVVHDLAWCRDRDRDRGRPRGRVAYSALGHGVESYAAPGHVHLLQRLVDWLVVAD